MEGTSQAAVTPEGVRDGDPAVLTALVARRGPAVLAFCEAVCEPAVAPRAVAEAFARFRALVATVEDAGGVDPEQFLLGATRHAAASMARHPSDGRGVLRVLGRGASPETYAALPALLAARADSMLGAEDLERLSRLLERSPGCREVEAAFRRAERGYRSPPERPVSGETITLIIAAMQAAAPVAGGFEIVPQPVPEKAEAVAPEAAPEPEPEPEPEPDAAEAATVDVTADAAPSGDEPDLADAEIVLPDPEPPTAVFEAVTDSAAFEAPDAAGEGTLAEQAGTAPEPHDAPAPVDEPAPFLPHDEPGTGQHDALHPTVPAVQPALLPLHEAGVALTAPPRGRRRLSPPSLPHGGGLHLPRRGRGAAPDGADASGPADHGPVYQLLLPAVAIIIAVLVMLAIAGVFGGADPAPAVIVAPTASVTPTTTGVASGTPALPSGTDAAAIEAARRAAVRRRAAARRVAASKQTAPAAAPATSATTTTSTATTSPVRPAAPAQAATPAPSPRPAAKPQRTSTAGTQESVTVLPSGSTDPGTGAEPVYTPGP
ncbi:MAG: hypothetical protein JWN65_1017 [Solirubrobacterales bacterium]|nr:hypothetical protein [Solirubrobacterales bacterium]